MVANSEVHNDQDVLYRAMRRRCAGARPHADFPIQPLTDGSIQQICSEKRLAMVGSMRQADHDLTFDLPQRSSLLDCVARAGSSIERLN